MKVTSLSTQDKGFKPFKPFTACIEFETEEEYRLIYEMLGYNISIPTTMDLPKRLFNRMGDLMDNLRQGLFSCYIATNE